jgi:hypothetical protein
LSIWRSLALRICSHGPLHRSNATRCPASENHLRKSGVRGRARCWILARCSRTEIGSFRSVPLRGEVQRRASVRLSGGKIGRPPARRRDPRVHARGRAFANLTGGCSDGCGSNPGSLSRDG